VKGRCDPPLPEGVQENVVRGTTLVAMELVEQTVPWMKLVGVLSRNKIIFLVIDYAH
jgi:hypothetical protein